MSSLYVKLGNRTLDQWKVTELKEELKKRKLSTSGLKQDLIKRLDEAVRLEMDDTQSAEPIENAYADADVSEIDKDIKDGDIGVVERVEPEFGNAVDDFRGASDEGKVIEADSVQGTKATGMEGDHGTNEDGAATSVLIDGHPPSSTPVVPLNEQDLQGSETGNEVVHSTEQRENDDLRHLQPDQPLKYQVPEVDPDLGFQVTSDSVSSEFVPIVEKNELKIDVIDDNVKLEMYVKPEMQQSLSDVIAVGGESHPMDIGEQLDKKDAEEPLDKNLLLENIGGGRVEKVDNLKSIDCGDIGPPEKLNLDRSSGDDSMEEDVMKSKLMDDKSDSFTENVEKSETPGMKEEEHVDVVGHDKPVEMVQHVKTKIANVESDTVSTLTSGKRKFIDKEAVGNNYVKKPRRWNAEGLKSSQPQSSSIIPKGLSEPSSKPIPGTNSMATPEAPKEAVVPPSSRAPTNSLRIDNFLRPFTLKAVQELLGKTGSLTSFWMDHIKTHCYVSFSSVEEAEQTRNSVYNLQWPPNGGRLLVADFVDPQEVKSRLEAPLPSPATPLSTTPSAQPSPRNQVSKQQIPPPLPPPPLSNPPHVRERLQPPREQPLPARDRLNLPPPPPLPEKIDPPIVTLDDLFRKTKAIPRIYYLPLSDELVAAKLKTQGKNATQ